ncbi:MAG TPA: hypothetical protein VJ991_04205 [Balneolales bacterium]|nr:hypothetical protein [Balneolales bacterium]
MKIKKTGLLDLVLVLLVMVISFVIISCGTGKKVSKDDMGDLGVMNVEKSGAVLWGENCGRCHNAPDPRAFSDLQWETLGKHMRIRAGLTADETQKIINFLQQSN